MPYVYIHKKPISKEIFYVGIGKSGDYKRATEFRRRNALWHNTVNKYGFIYEIVDDNISWQKACDIEKELIKLLGRKDLNIGKLVNMTDGGDGTYNVIVSDKTREKLKLANTNRFHDWGDKISASKKGIKFSEEHKLKLSEARKGKRPDQKCIDKLVMYNKSGIKRTFEYKNSVPVIQLSLNNDFIAFFKSVKEAARNIDCNPSCIRQVLRGKAKTAKGYIFMKIL
jgi:hypothetical protein